MQKIRTELEIAYLCGDSFVFLPYLDLGRRNEILGIKVGSLVVSVKDTGLNNWHLAKILAMKSPEVGCKSAQLPSISDFPELFASRYKFNRTIVKLKEWRVAADFWNFGKYHAKESIGYERHFVFDMEDGIKLEEANGYDQVYTRLVYCV